jgi:hypothetical protein
MRVIIALNRRANVEVPEILRDTDIPQPIRELRLAGTQRRVNPKCIKRRHRSGSVAGFRGREVVKAAGHAAATYRAKAA